MPGKTIHGHAIVFDRWSLDLGGFKERIAPQAIERTLRNLSEWDLRALWSHQPDQPLARWSSGTLRVAKDRHGLVAEIDLPATRADIAELVERRDVRGMSFGFMTLADSWADGALPERTILDMAVREVSLVAWPAYVMTTASIRAASVTARAARPECHPQMGFLSVGDKSDYSQIAFRRVAGAMEERAMWEYAVTRDSNGERVAHSAAQVSLERFLAARAERDDKGGLMTYRSVYNRQVGRWECEWVPRASVVDAMLKDAEDRARGW